MHKNSGTKLTCVCRSGLSDRDEYRTPLAKLHRASGKRSFYSMILPVGTDFYPKPSKKLKQFQEKA